MAMFSGVLVYTVYWSIVAIRRGSWGDTKQRTVTRNDNSRLYWAGIGIMLAVGFGLFTISTLLVVFRLSILRFLGTPS